MTKTTTRYALNTPEQFDADNVPAWMLTLATQLDGKVMGFSQGTLAARPVGGTVYGKWYYATDTAELFQYQPTDLNNPTGWRKAGTMPTVPAARYTTGYQQSLQPPYADAITAVQVPWSWGPGQPAYTGAYPNASAMGWSAGPYITPPIPGVYRVHGQITFQHEQPYLGGGTWRQGSENYGVWVYRSPSSGRGSLPPGGNQVCYQQASDAWLGSPVWPVIGYPTVEFSALVALDFSDADHQSVEVWVASSVSGTFASPPNVLQTIFNTTGGIASYLEMELVGAV